MSQMIYCRGCGKELHESARTCPTCGAIQKVNPYPKSKVIFSPSCRHEEKQLYLS